MSYTDQAYLADSYELKAFAKRHKKTDKIDAKLIAEILRRGYLPTVFMPDKQTRKIRAMLRYRMNLVRDRAQNIHRLKAFLDKLGLDSAGDFTTFKRLDETATLDVPAEHRKIINGYRECICSLTRRINDMEKFIRKHVCKDPDILNLISVPGLDYFSAALIKTEIITIDRFRDFTKLCAYAGLAPKVSQSANRLTHGPLNTNRRKHLQWIILEVVWHFIRRLPDKQARYERIAKRKNTNTAKVSLARDMLKVIYCILKEKRPFYENKKQIRSAAACALYGV